MFIRYLKGLFAFFPLLVFVTYALWNGPPPEARWLAAYKIASPLALAQLAWSGRSPAPISRLLLGANLYLLVGGLCAWLNIFEGLRLLATLKGAGVLLSIMVVGIFLTFGSRAGFVGAKHGDRKQIFRNSLWLLMATLLAFGVAMAFRESPRYGTAIPLVVLVVLNRVFRDRAEQPT